MEISKRNYGMNKIVLAEQEAFEARRQELNEIKMKAYPYVVTARNERLDAIGKERALLEQNTKQYQNIRNTPDKLMKSMEDTAMTRSQVPYQGFIDSMQNELQQQANIMYQYDIEIFKYPK
jgi:hypothetical protein